MTTRYFISDIKCRASDGGMACGPVPGVVTGAVQYKKDDEEPMWLTLSDVMGIASFYQTAEDIYNKILEMDNAESDEEEDYEFIDKLNDDYYIRSFEGISFGDYGDFREILQNICNNADNPAANLVKYLIAIVRCGWDELPGLLEAGKGKYADEIDLTAIDVE